MPGETAVEVDILSQIRTRWVDRIQRGEVPSLIVPGRTVITTYKLTDNVSNPETVRAYQTFGTVEEAVECLLPYCKPGYVPPLDIIGKDYQDAEGVCGQPPGVDEEGTVVSHREQTPQGDCPG